MKKQIVFSLLLMLMNGQALFAGAAAASKGASDDLFDALYIGNRLRAERLIKSGNIPHLNVKDVHGRTPLMVAALQGYDELVKYLIGKKADVTLQDITGDTALHHAADGGSVVSVNNLIAAGADINAQNKFKETPIFLATRSNHVKVVKELLGKRELDLGLKNLRGQTVAMLAKDLAREEILLLFNGSEKETAAAAAGAGRLRGVLRTREARRPSLPPEWVVPSEECPPAAAAAAAAGGRGRSGSLDSSVDGRPPRRRRERSPLPERFEEAEKIKTERLRGQEERRGG